MDDLPIGDRFVIPANELIERFETSGGPGGQHANRSATRVVLSFDVAASETVDPDAKRRIVEKLGPRLRDGVVTVDAGESRSQWRNRQAARRRLRELLEEALRPEPPPRRPTRPGAAARRRRLEEKRARGEVKRLRRRPDIE